MAISFASKIVNRSADRALVVDALNVSFRYKHAGIIDFADNLKSTIESIAQSYGCGTIIICADWGSSTYRLRLDPLYKSARKESYATQTQEEADEFQEFLQGYERALELLSEYFPVLRYKGVEADDIAAFVVKHREDIGLDHIWLLSSDKDWDLLIGDHVSRFSTVTRKETTAANWSEHYPIPVDVYADYKCLIGDKGDSIPGVDKVGPKRATALLEEYGSLLSIVDSIPLPGKYVYVKNVNSSKDRLVLNMKLIDLLTYCTEAIGHDNVVDIIDKIKYGIGNNTSAPVIEQELMDDDI